MSWSTPNPAIPYATASSGFLAVTSTSTIYHGGSPLLYMFMTRPGSIAVSEQESRLDAEVNAAHLVEGSTTTSYIGYLASDAAGNFAIDTASSTYLHSTFIAAERDATSWTLEYIEAYSPLWRRTTKLPADARATYADPSVVAVPDALGGGYLMLLSRSRTLDTADTPGTKLSSIGDIVCYWSSDPTFLEVPPTGRGGVVIGPILLVDSLEALPEVDARVWCGLPTAAFVTDEETGEASLFVYYGVEIPRTPYLAVEIGPEYRHGWLASEYRTFFENQQGFIACKRLRWTNVESALRSATLRAGLWKAGLADPHETAWTRTDAVSGQLLGRVRIWIPELGDKYGRTLAREFFTVYGDAIQRVADPEVEACDHQPEQPQPRTSLRPRWATSSPDPAPRRDNVRSLNGAASPVSLYFRSVNEVRGGGVPPSWRSGHGFWRGSSIPEGTSLFEADTGAVHTTTFGVDFAVHRNAPMLPSPDMVFPADYHSALENPFDPDPVRVDNGSGWQWWVYGGLAVTGVGSAHLGRVNGTYADGCKSWQDAWTFTSI